MHRPIQISSEGLSNPRGWTWRHRGQLHATVVAEVGFRVGSDGSLVVDPQIASPLEEMGTLRLPHAEIVVVGGPCGWLRTWRGQAVRLDKSGAHGLGPLPDFAPTRAERLRGRPAPQGDPPHLPDDFDFDFFQLTPPDQWLDRLAPGDVVAMYDPAVQHPLLTITVPDEVVSLSGGHTATLSPDRLYVDLDKHHVVLGFRGSFPLDERATTQVHVARGEGRPSRREASQPPPDEAPPVDATMGVMAAMSDAATPFAAAPAPSSRRGLSFADLRRQSAAPSVPADAVDATLGLGFASGPGSPPPSVPAPVAPPSSPVAPPSAPSLPGAPVEPVMVGEVEAAPQTLETVAAPDVAGELDIQLTALPVSAEGAPPPSAPAAPAPKPSGAPSPDSTKKTKKKDVRNALLRKMRRK